MRALGSLLLALLAPTAAACSLAGPVPGPGAFTLVPMEGGEPIVIAVDGRELSSMCGLSNPFALEGERFLWRETEWGRNDVRYTAHVLDLSTGKTRVVPYGEGHTQGFWTWNGTLLYVDEDYDGDRLPPRGLVRQLDLATGALTTLPFPDANLVSVTSADGLVMAIARSNGHEGPDAVWLYDLRERAWLLEGAPMRELVGADVGWGSVLSRDWLQLSAQNAHVLHHIPTGETRPWREMVGAAGFPYGGVLVEGWWYTTRWEDGNMTLLRARFPDGEPERVGAYPGSIVGVLPGYVVLGAYSAPELHPLGRLQWVEERGVLVGGAALWLTGVVALPAWRMLRARRR